jgi:hypothetical protein
MSKKAKSKQPARKKYVTAGALGYNQANYTGSDFASPYATNPFYYDAGAAMAAQQQMKSAMSASQILQQRASEEKKVRDEEEKTRQAELKSAREQAKIASEQEVKAVGMDAATTAGDLGKQYVKQKLVEKATQQAATNAIANTAMQAGQAGVYGSTLGTAANTAASVGLGGTQVASFAAPTTSTVAGTLVPGAVEVGSQVGQAAANSGGSVVNAAGTGASLGAGLATAGIGLGLNIGGTLLEKSGDDYDPTTFTEKERKRNLAGSAMKSAGTGVGTGAAIGSFLGPGGTVIGGAIGGLVGGGIGLIKAKKENKEAKKIADEYQQAENVRLAEIKAQEARIAAENAKIAGAYNAAFVKSRLAGAQSGYGYSTSNNPSMMTTPSFYGETGGVRVPGGKVVPIEGSDAVEFVGNKHSEKKIDGVSGIRPFPDTEVEGGETMDQVMMAKSGGKGKMNDYFFSAYLKLGGKSFAQRHKEILKSGGKQADIQKLAEMQEAVANKEGEKDRSPDTIAKYAKGGKKQLPPKSLNYIDSTPWSSAFISYVYSNADPNFPKSPTHTGYATGLKNRDDWQELDPATTKLQPGDIIVNNRSGNKQKFGQSSYSGFSHGDIVTKLEGDKVYAIGGNVDPDDVNPDTPDTVAERAKSLKDGVLADSGYFVVLRPKDPQVAQRAVELATNEKQLWESNKWNEHADTSQSRLQTYYQAGKLGIPGVRPDDGKPAAVSAKPQASNQTMSADQYAALNQGRQPLPSGAAQSVLGPIDYALLGVGRALASGASGLAGGAAGAWEGFAGTASAPNASAARPTASAPNMAGRGPLMLEAPTPSTAVGRFTGNIGPAKPTTPFRVVPTETGLVRQPPFYTDPNYINIEGRTIGLNKPSSIDNQMFKQFNIGMPDATAQKAAGFTPTGFDVTAAEGTAAVDPGTEGPFPYRETLQPIKSKEPGLLPTKIAKPDLKKDTGLKKTEKKVTPPRDSNINGALLAGLGQLLPVGALLASPYKTTAGIDTSGAEFKGESVAPGSVVRGATLGRVSLGAERAAAIANSNAINKYIEGTNAGPAAIVGKLANSSRLQQNMLQIQEEESKINTAIQNKEAELGQRASEFNAQQAMEASAATAENRQRASESLQKAKMFNKQLELNEKQYKREEFFGALDEAATRIAGIYKDDRSYKAQERLANAMDDAGSYQRFQYYEDLKKQAKDPQSEFYGKTDKELRDYAADQYNQYIGKAKTGGTRRYTSRLGELSKGKKTFNI